MRPLAISSDVRSYYGALIVVVVIGLAASAISFQHMREMSGAEVSERFRSAARDRIDVIRLEIFRSLDALRSTADLYEASEVVDAGEFRTFVSAIRRRQPGLHFVIEAPRVRHADREAFESESVRGRPPRPIVDLGTAGERRPAGRRDVYVPILFVDPLDRHGFDIGVDLRQIPQFAAPMAASGDSGALVLSGRFDASLLKESAGGFAVLAFQPLYAKDDAVAPDQGRPRVLGYLAGGYVIRDLVEHAMVHVDPVGIDVAIRDLSAADSERFLYVHSSRRRSTSVVSGFAETPSPRSANRRYTDAIDIGGRRWEFVLSPVPGLFEPDLMMSWLVLAAGLAMTGGLATHMALLARAARRLSASERQFRDFAEASSDWLWTMGADLRFTWFSSQFEIRTGIPSEALIGRRRDELPGAPGQSDEDWRGHLADLEATRPFKDFRYSVVADDGRVRIVSVSGVPVFGDSGAFAGYRGTGADVTEQVETEIRARQAHARLVDAIESISEGWAMFDKSDRLVLCNSSYRDSLSVISDVLEPGVPFERMVRALTERGYYQDAEGREEEWIAERVADHREKGPRAPHRVVGDRWMLSRTYPTQDGGTVLIRADITQVKDAEQRMRQAEKMQGLGNLAAGISHELNNMLLPMLELARATMRDFPAESEARENLEMVVEAGERAKDLVGQIVAFGHHDADGREVVDVGAVVRHTLDLFKSTVPRTIRVSEDVEPSAGTAAGNADDLATVFLNVAGNGIDAMDGRIGELGVTVKRTAIGGDAGSAVEGLGEGDYVRLRISDTGRGMDDSTIARAFDPFFTTKTVGDGIGMGLAVVHGIVTRHGGAVVIDSEPDAGTTVDVYLPCAGDRPAATP